MAEFDYFEALLHHTSKSMELDLSDILQSYCPTPQTSFYQCPQNQSMQGSEECHSEQDSTQQNSSSFDHSRHETSGSSLSSKTRRIMKENLKSYRGVENSDSEDETPVRKQMRHKKRKGEKQDGYPTKNFLPNFKGPHIAFLYNELGQERVNKFQIIQIIKAKNGISMKDYETLYRVEQFQEAFKLFFKSKVLYRQLMLSRSSMKARKVHMKKLSVFEKAFNEKVFQRIN